jgi:hypothetical protein
VDSPLSLSPQQTTTLSVVMAHAWMWWALTSWKIPDGTLARLLMRESAQSPQHSIRPSGLSPQDISAPDATCWNLPEGGFVQLVGLPQQATLPSVRTAQTW